MRGQIVADESSLARTESAIWNIFKIAGTRGADVSRCRRGAIQPVKRAAKRTDPARPRTAARRPAHRLGSAGGLATEQGDQRQGQAGRREPLSAITAGSVSLVVMLIPGPVITSG